MIKTKVRWAETLIVNDFLLTEIVIRKREKEQMTNIKKTIENTKERRN